MKRFLLPIIAGAMFSTSALSAPSMKIDATNLVLPTGDQVISDLYNQNTGGINNVSLSKYEQAWMIVHEKDTLFKHKTFWVRTGKVFTGIAVDDLKDLNKSDRTELIIDKVKRSVIEAAIIEELNKTIEMKDIKIGELNAMIEAKDLKIENQVSEISDLNKRIGELEKAKESLFTAEDLKLEFTRGVTSVELPDRASIVKNARDSVTEDDKTPRNFGLSPVSLTDDIGNKFDDAVTGRGITTADVKMKDLSNGDTQYTAVVNGTPIGFAFVNDNTPLIHAIEQTIANTYNYGYSDGFDAGYDAGYSDGFEDGYNAGYNDGFKNGVASVK